MMLLEPVNQLDNNCPSFNHIQSNPADGMSCLVLSSYGISADSAYRLQVREAR